MCDGDVSHGSKCTWSAALCEAGEELAGGAEDEMADRREGMLLPADALLTLNVRLEMSKVEGGGGCEAATLLAVSSRRSSPPLLPLMLLYSCHQHPAPGPGFTPQCACESTCSHAHTPPLPRTCRDNPSMQEEREQKLPDLSSTPIIQYLHYWCHTGNAPRAPTIKDCVWEKGRAL